MNRFHICFLSSFGLSSCFGLSLLSCPDSGVVRMRKKGESIILNKHELMLRKLFKLNVYFLVTSPFRRPIPLCSCRPGCSDLYTDVAFAFLLRNQCRMQISTCRYNFQESEHQPLTMNHESREINVNKGRIHQRA